MDKILERLTVARTEAMKAKIAASTDADLAEASLRLDTFRGVIGEIDKESKLANGRTVLAIVKSEYSKRLASAEEYAGYGETERSEREAAEAAVLSEYVPAETTEAELRAFATEFIAANGLAGLGGKALGQVMGAMKAEFSNYDGKLASTIVRELVA